jgi:hypothetical protein
MATGAGAGAGAGARAAAAASPDRITFLAYVHPGKLNTEESKKIHDALEKAGIEIRTENPIAEIAEYGEHICGGKFTNKNVAAFLKSAVFFLAAYNTKTKQYVGFITLNPVSGLYVDLLCGKGQKGVGKLLLDQLETVAKHLEIETIDLNALAYEPLVKYYKDRGFHILNLSKQRTYRDLVSMQKNLTGTRTYTDVTMRNIGVEPIVAPSGKRANASIPAQIGIYLFAEPQRDLLGFVADAIKIEASSSKEKTKKTKKTKRVGVGIVSGDGIDGLPAEPDVYALLSKAKGHSCKFDGDKCDNFTSAMILYKYKEHTGPLAAEHITDYTFAYFDKPTSSLTFECFCTQKGGDNNFVNELKAFAEGFGFHKIRFRQSGTLKGSGNLPMQITTTERDRSPLYWNTITLKGGGKTRRRRRKGA